MDSDSDNDHTRKRHANRHVAPFLALPDFETDTLQIIPDGRRLTAEKLLKNDSDLTLTKPIVVQDTPESIGMKVLRFPNRDVAVRDIADILGHRLDVHVIDVEHQEELVGWTLADLVDYFEDEERLFLQARNEVESLQAAGTQRSRRRRKAAEKCLENTAAGRPRVLNQISLEFSKLPLRNEIQSPQFVRDLDWIDQAWPREPEEPWEVYPNVQFYCLTSAAGCYTDFHVDFGGTSVWYHILSGDKMFCLIRPTRENLALYEQWLCSPDQDKIFLPTMIPDQQDVIRLTLKASQTLVIPTAWIHAVYTPTDSLVLGGNFMHGLDVDLQLEVHCIESRTRVQEKFRFPHYLTLNFYAGGMYLDKLRRGCISKREVEGVGLLVDALDEWWKVQKGQTLQTGPTVVSAAEECAKKNGCANADDFLTELRKEYERVVANGIVPNPNFAPPLSPSKQKLKLKLNSNSKPPSPPGSASPGGDKIRITLSSTVPKLNVSAPRINRVKPKRPREDTEWVDQGPTVDDDWMPGATKKREPKANKRRSSTSVGRTKQPGAVKSKPSAPPKKASARDRLMKRFSR